MHQHNTLDDTVEAEPCKKHGRRVNSNQIQGQGQGYNRRSNVSDLDEQSKLLLGIEKSNATTSIAMSNLDTKKF